MGVTAHSCEYRPRYFAICRAFQGTQPLRVCQPHIWSSLPNFWPRSRGDRVPNSVHCMAADSSVRGESSGMAISIGLSDKLSTGGMSDMTIDLPLRTISACGECSGRDPTAAKLMKMRSAFCRVEMWTADSSCRHHIRNAPHAPPAAAMIENASIHQSTTYPHIRVRPATVQGDWPLSFPKG